MYMYTIINAEDYFYTLYKKIREAKDYIYIQAMSVEFSLHNKIISDEIIESAKRGVKVYINIDWYSKMYTGKQMNKLPIINKGKRDLTYKIRLENLREIQKMKKVNVDIAYLNRPNNTFGEYIPFIGRNHMKFTIVDNCIYIGGTNLSVDSFSNIDFMMESCNKKLINSSITLFFENRNIRSLHPSKIQIANDTSLLIDSGKIGDSIIYRNSLDLTDKAQKSIKYVSQFLPDFELLKKMKQAKRRGVSVDIMTYHKGMALSKVKGRVEQLLFNIFSEDLSATQIKKYVHAKLLIIDNINTIFGSHNFSKFGVLFGTKEIAINSTNPDLILSLNNWLDNVTIRNY